MPADFAARVKAAEAEATPGPWHRTIYVSGAVEVTAEDHTPVAQDVLTRPTAALIVLLRNAVPEIVALVEALHECAPEPGERCPLCLHDDGHGEECPFDALAALDKAGG